MKRLLFGSKRYLLLWAGILSLTLPAKCAPICSLGDLQFLIGTWDAQSSTADRGIGYFSFTPRINHQRQDVIVRVNHVVYPAHPNQETGTTVPEEVHDDLMVIAPGANGLTATFVDNEGNTIDYSLIQCPDSKFVVFQNFTDTNVPLFKFTYDLADDGTLTTRFWIPGRKTPYKEGTARRRR